jgi:hypothetical protein
MFGKLFGGENASAAEVAANGAALASYELAANKTDLQTSKKLTVEHSAVERARTLNNEQVSRTLRADSQEELDAIRANNPKLKHDHGKMIDGGLKQLNAKEIKMRISVDAARDGVLGHALLQAAKGEALHTDKSRLSLAEWQKVNDMLADGTIQTEASLNGTYENWGIVDGKLVQDVRTYNGEPGAILKLKDGRDIVLKDYCGNFEFMHQGRKVTVRIPAQHQQQKQHQEQRQHQEQQQEQEQQQQQQQQQVQRQEQQQQQVKVPPQEQLIPKGDTGGPGGNGQSLPAAEQVQSPPDNNSGGPAGIPDNTPKPEGNSGDAGNGGDHTDDQGNPIR